MFALLLISVAVILVAIGLRLRSLAYAGTALLLFDLVAMVVRSTIHNLNLLWILGVLLGVGVIALAAFCENHRDKLVSRIQCPVGRVGDLGLEPEYFKPPFFTWRPSQ